VTAIADTVELAPNVSAALLADLVERADVTSGAGETTVLAPFTETPLASVPVAGQTDVQRAVAAARIAQAGWARRPVSERAKVLSRFHDLLVDRADVAMDIVQLEAGKARIPAFEEVFDTVATTRYYLHTGPALLKRQRRAVSFPILSKAFEYRHPVGVVGSISPWNFPFNLSVADIVPALLAGNAVVSKPDEKTPFSLLYGVSLLEEAGLPPGLVQVVTGPGEDIGPTLIDGVDFVLFTGSTEVGRLVAERAGKRLIGSSMELGGKNAAIVLADADLDRTIPGIGRAMFANGGQLCISTERIYVDESIGEEFTTRLVDYTRGMTMTTGFDFSSIVSSMIDRNHLERVHAHVEDAIENGATVLTGGKPRPDLGPLFYEPTLLTDVDESMSLCRDETFGPVASIYGYDELDSAIGLANDSDLGLNYSVWTADEARGVEIAAELHAGTVGVNDGYAAAWSSYDAPMGGFKSSGLGRRHGSVGLLKFTESQTVAVQRYGKAFAPLGSMTYDSYQRILGPALKLLRRLPFYK
jgi:succinate-semialdehyde dehydrogenase/glutarate-semialdehyde dehydrogenase